MGSSAGAIGNVVGAVGGGFLTDRAISKGVGKAQAGYNQAQSTLTAGKQEGLGYLQPYMGIGEQAISPLSTLLLGKSYDPETGEFSEVSPEDRMSAFTASPDYQFRLSEGQKALEASQAARGGLLSGRAMRESQELGQNQAASEYGNYLGRLMGLAGMGQASSGQAANIAGNVAGQIGQAQIGAGNVAMQGKIARGQNMADVLGATTGALGGYFQGGGGAGAGAGAFSDINLKEDIHPIRKSTSGIPIYHFSYKDKKYGEGKFEGVIAQDLLILKPEAVIKDGDYLKVDYSKIDVEFRRVA